MIILYTGFILIIISLMSKKKLPCSLGFFFVFVIMAFQEGVEGDYMSYKDTFNYKIDERTAEDEPFWNFLMYFFYPLGWRTFVIVLSVFQVWVLTIITKKYADEEYRWISPILFFFWFGMMLIQMKAMRQALAIELCILPFALNISNKKHKWLWCFVPSVLAFYTHNSSVVFIPILILYYIHLIHEKVSVDSQEEKQRNDFFYPIFLTALFLVIYIGKRAILNDYLTQISLMYSDFRLAGYASLNEVDGDLLDVSMLIIVADAIFVFMNTWAWRRTKGTTSIFMIAAICASFFDMLFFGLGSLARIGYYYLPAMIVALPTTTSQIKQRFGKTKAYGFIALVIIYAIKTSLPWMTGVNDGRFGTYRFFFM